MKQEKVLRESNKLPANLEDIQVFYVDKETAKKIVKDLIDDLTDSGVGKMVLRSEDKFFVFKVQ